MKASGITNISCKKGGYNIGESSMSKSSPLSPLQVDGEAHFHVNTNGVNNYSAIPNDKSLERAYSKKFPGSGLVIPKEEMPFAIRLPVKAKSQTSLTNRASPPTYFISKVEHQSSGPALPRKRKAKEEDLAPSKVPKVAPQSKDASQSGSLRISPRSRSTPNCDADADSDVEIVAVKPASRSVRKLNNALPQNGRKKSRYFDHKINHNEITMNEADIAPAMSTDSFTDGQPAASNSMQWLSANGSAEPGHKTPAAEAAPSIPKSSDLSSLRQAFETISQELNNHSQNFFEKPSTSKATPQHPNQPVVSKSPSKNFKTLQVSSPESPKPHKANRELKNLIEDILERKLNSRSQKVQESKPSSEDISKKIDSPSKNVNKKPAPTTPKSSDQPGTSRPKKSRELTSLYRNLDEIAWAQESSFKKLLRNPNYIRHSERSPKTERPRGRKQGKLKVLCKMFPRSTKKAQKLLDVKATEDQASSVKDKPKESYKPKASGSGKVKPINIKKEIIDEETNVFYMLNPGSSDDDPKDRQQEKPCKGKAVKPDWKPDSMPKVKTESSKTKFSTLKSTKRSPSPETVNGKKSLKGCLSLVSVKKLKDPSASTSGLQKNGKSKSLPSIAPHSKAEHRCNGEDLSLNGDGEDLFVACQNASKCQVRVQPLEHTNFWTNDFYEGFRKHFLDQALKKALESREMDSSYVMFQDMLGTLVGTQGGGGRRRRPEEEALRCSARQSEGAFRYKEIVVKKHPNYMQLILVPNTAKQNSLTVEAMKELKEALLLAKKDPNCRAVLINSSGPYFCTGIDLSPLVGNNKKQAAEEISISIRDLVMTLGVFPKPVVAAVNGAALGFGVSILTYCDVVLASDKATFCLPATKIGYIPEGGVTYTLPQVVGSSVASEMLMQGRRITAEQACRYGLVSEVIWPTRLMNEVIPRLQNIISQPLQGLEATKTMVRCRLWDKLKSHVEREREMLCEHWASTVCQNNIKTLLQTGWLLE